jgi:hypothetical protein
MDIKITINLPNKIILWCAAIELFHLDKNYYIENKMGIKQVYKALKKELIKKVELQSLRQGKEVLFYITLSITIQKGFIEKDYKILFKVRSLNNEKKTT